MVRSATIADETGAVTPTTQGRGLTLGRTPGDAIVLRTPSGKTIATITVNDIEVMASGATTTRIEIEAPTQVEILRGELLDQR